MTLPRVLITRTQPAASMLAVRVMDLGLPVHIAPILSVHDMHSPAPSAVFDAGGYILTSPNGLRFAHIPHKMNYDLPLWAVGEATARFAKDAGFSHVITGPGEIRGLGRLIKKDYQGDKPLIHIRGAHVSLFTHESLDGLPVLPWITYETRVDENSLASIPKFLSLPQKHIIVLQSARAAGFLAPHVQACAQRLKGGDISVLCLSQAVVESLGMQENDGIYCCDSPDEESVLAHLRRLKVS